MASVAAPERTSAGEYTCNCEEQHRSKVECEISSKRKTHLEISAKVMEANPDTIRVYIGNDGTTELVVVRALLTLHTPFFEGCVFQKRYRSKATGQEFIRDAIRIPPEISKPDLRQLMYWICNGKLNLGEENNLEDPSPASLWQLGVMCQMPAFQNSCVDMLRNYFAKEHADEKAYPNIEDVKRIYDTSTKYNQTRYLAADALARRVLSQHRRDGSNRESRTWASAITRVSGLMADLSWTGAQDWDGKLPWDDSHRSRYMVDEVPLEQLLEERILKPKREREAAESAAAAIPAADSSDQQPGDNTTALAPEAPALSQPPAAVQTPQQPASPPPSAAFDDESTPRPKKRPISEAQRAYIDLVRDNAENEDTPRPPKRPFREGEVLNDEASTPSAKQDKGKERMNVEIEDENEDAMMYEG